MGGTRQLWQERQERYLKQVESEIEHSREELASLGAEMVILFGSAGREETRLGSDIDLIVVMKSDLDFIERTAALYKALQPRLDADILVYTPQEFAKVSQTSSLVRRALAEGRRLIG
ncbi:MAG: nucleotidyltransferase domain-containing protein [Anaerolineae bacterium]